MLTMAHKDLKALKGMTDPDLFEEEIFGFHAQQAVEKALKAWLALVGREYPLTHDISALLANLESGGLDVKQFWGLVEYNVFAIRFRYESLEGYDQTLDRDASVEAVNELVQFVQRLIEETQETE